MQDTALTVNLRFRFLVVLIHHVPEVSSGGLCKVKQSINTKTAKVNQHEPHQREGENEHKNVSSEQLDHQDKDEQLWCDSNCQAKQIDEKADNAHLRSWVGFQIAESVS